MGESVGSTSSPNQTRVCGKPRPFDVTPEVLVCQRETHTLRQRKRDRGRKTGREERERERRDRETDRETKRGTERERERERQRQIERQTERASPSPERSRQSR